jgi:hypothetical protein
MIYFTDSRGNEWNIEFANHYVYFNREGNGSFYRTIHQVLSPQYFYLKDGEEEVVLFAKKILKNKAFI